MTGIDVYPITAGLVVPDQNPAVKGGFERQ